MTGAEIRQVLLVEVHRLIARAAADGIGKIGRPRRRKVEFTEEERAYLEENQGKLDLTRPAAQKLLGNALSNLLTYPPEDVLTDREEEELASMRLSEPARSALQKAIADACASAFFHFFCLMDAVGHPEVVPVADWPVTTICETDTIGDWEMLHDAFYEAYWRFRSFGA